MLRICICRCFECVNNSSFYQNSVSTPNKKKLRSNSVVKFLFVTRSSFIAFHSSVFEVSFFVWLFCFGVFGKIAIGKQNKQIINTF